MPYNRLERMTSSQALGGPRQREFMVAFEQVGARSKPWLAKKAAKFI